MLGKKYSNAPLPSILGHQWADRFIQVGRELFRASESDDHVGLRMVFVLPTVAFSESLMAMGFLLEKYESKFRARATRQSSQDWSLQLGNQFALMYRDAGSIRRTCLRNGTLVQTAESNTGYGLFLEGGNKCYTKNLSHDDLTRLTSPVPGRYTTTTRRNSHCSQSIKFLISCLGSEFHALNFSRYETPSLLLDCSSRTRLREESTEEIDVNTASLRLEDVVRVGHQHESLPPSVFWRDHEQVNENTPRIFSGSQAISENSRSRRKAPTIFILGRKDPDLAENLDMLIAKYNHPRSTKFTKVFKNKLGLDKQKSTGLIAWQ